MSSTFFIYMSWLYCEVIPNQTLLKMHYHARIMEQGIFICIDMNRGLSYCKSTEKYPPNPLIVPLILQPGVQLFCSAQSLIYQQRKSAISYHIISCDISLVVTVFLLIPNDQNFQRLGERILSFAKFASLACVESFKWFPVFKRNTCTVNQIISDRLIVNPGLQSS